MGKYSKQRLTPTSLAPEDFLGHFPAGFVMGIQNWFYQKGGLARLKSGVAHTPGAGWQAFSNPYQNKNRVNTKPAIGLPAFEDSLLWGRL